MGKRKGPSNFSYFCDEKFVGEFIGYSVRIEGAQAKKIYHCGYFGKGVLSRSEPTFRFDLLNRFHGGEVTDDRRAFHSKKARFTSSSSSSPSSSPFASSSSSSSSFPPSFSSSSSPSPSSSSSSHAPLCPPSPALPLPPSLIELSSRDPETQEPLQLGLEEAFFLAYALGTLTITISPSWLSLVSPYLPDDLPEEAFHSQQNFELPIHICWNIFQKVQPSFVERYVVYHYYRSLGWVVRSGLKFGTDFVLYRKSPAFVHADYAVRITCKENFPLVCDEWCLLQQVDRVIEKTAKKLLVCRVVWPPEQLSFIELDSLSQFRVDDMVMSRWLPKG